MPKWCSIAITLLSFCYIFLWRRALGDMDSISRWIENPQVDKRANLPFPPHENWPFPAVPPSIEAWQQKSIYENLSNFMLIWHQFTRKNSIEIDLKSLVFYNILIMMMSPDYRTKKSKAIQSRTKTIASKTVSRAEEWEENFQKSTTKSSIRVHDIQNSVKKSD